MWFRFGVLGFLGFWASGTFVSGLESGLVSCGLQVCGWGFGIQGLGYEGRGLRGFGFSEMSRFFWIAHTCARPRSAQLTVIWEFLKIRGTLFGGPYNKDPIILFRVPYYAPLFSETPISKSPWRLHDVSVGSSSGFLSSTCLPFEF